MISLVTGGAGFLGSHLVDALLRDGDDVIVLDDLSTGSVCNLEFAVRSRRCTFVYGDVSQPVRELNGLLQPALAGERLDKIYHLASAAGPSAYGTRPWETLLANSIGTISLVELALECKARFLYASTSEIYGDAHVNPQPETYFGSVDTIGERACYAEAKRFGEAVVSVGVRSRGLDARILRLFNCYGPRMSSADGGLIPAFLAAAESGRSLPIHGSGLQTRSLTFVDDAIELVRIIMGKEQSILEPINVGNDDERSIIEIARVFSRAAEIPFNIEYLPGRSSDPQRRIPDLGRARLLGWVAAISLEDGLQSNIDWFRRTALSYV